MEFYYAWVFYIWGVLVQKKINIGLLTILVLLGTIMFWLSSSFPIGMDEYVFYRLSDGLPNYSTSPDWIYVDNTDVLCPTDPRGSERIHEVVIGTYTTPIYPHTPLVPAIMWPAVKLFGDGEYVSAEGVTALRTITIILSLLTFYVLFLVVQRRIGGNALLFAFPVMIASRTLPGAIWIYWEVFMMFFFAITLYLLETHKGPKWLPFVTACVLVNTKLFLGVLFLLPLVLKDKRLILCVLSLIPWWTVAWIVTGDPIYFIHFYLGQVGFHDEIYTRLTWWLTVWRTDFILFFVVTLGSVLLIRRYPTFILFYIATIVYGFGTGLGMNHLSAILYGGAVAFPLLADKLLRRVYTPTCPVCKQSRLSGEEYAIQCC